MKCIVTGGAGFIGSHLVDELVKDYDEVTVIDNFSEGKLENLPVDNSRLLVVNGDILDNGIHRHFRNVDIVFHLAALPRPQFSIKNPVLTTVVNVEGTVRILELCRVYNVHRFIFISSGSVYGESNGRKSVEDGGVYPMSTYALTKIIGEQYCDLYSEVYGLTYNALRLFNVYGTRMNSNGEYASLIPRFIYRNVHDDYYPVFGDGHQARDFVHVDDVVRAIILASESSFVNGIYNIGTGLLTSVLDIADIINKLTNKELVPAFLPPIIEPRMSLADNRKAKQLLGWEPKISLEDGIKGML